MSLGNVLIFGDSYSTFEGYIPQEYGTYYSAEDTPKTDVRKVEETWWYQLIQETDSHLALNDSWSGSTIGYTGWNGSDGSQSFSFIYRLQKMIDDGFFKENNMDTVFVFGGTNDCWSDAPLGEMKFADWTKEDLYCVLPAVSYFIKFLTETLPDAKVYCLINNALKPEFEQCVKDACARFGATAIQLENITKNCNHPTIQGMLDIKEQILNVINK